MRRQIVNKVCETINQNFINRGFTFQQIKDEMNDQNITDNYLRFIIHNLSKNGAITISHPYYNQKLVRYSPTGTINPERIKTSSRMLRNKYLGRGTEANPNMFSDENHPAKRYITESFYSTFSTYLTNVRNMLSVCGPEVERFVRNASKIKNIRSGHIDMIECSPSVARIIDEKLARLNLAINNWTLHEMRLEDFIPPRFYQFQELDCEGGWKLLYEPYVRMLMNQAQNTTLIKGTVITTFNKVGNVELKHYINQFLSNLGARFRHDNVLDVNVRRRIPGDGWRYVHQYSEFPNVLEYGRIIKLLCYKYSGKGCPMFTCLVIYR